MTDQREQFEAWASKKYGRHLPADERDECGYFDLRTDAAWQAWCASAAATREECAKVCEEVLSKRISEGNKNGFNAVHQCMGSIRALGTQSGMEG